MDLSRLRSFSRLSLISALIVGIYACGGGGGGSDTPTATPVASTPTPTPTDVPQGPKPTEAPVLTLELGAPTSNPIVIPPSANATNVQFLAIVSGTFYPEQLSLDEVDSDGNVLSSAVSQLKDDGTDGDTYRGDRTYSGYVSVDSVSSEERFYRVRADKDNKTLYSGMGSFWISGCPPIARPSNPAKAVFDDTTNSYIFSDELLLTLSDSVAPELSQINAILTDVGGQVVGCIPALRQYLVEIADNTTVADVYADITTLMANTDVVDATPNTQILGLIESAAFTCDDQDCQWYLDRIRAPQAWALAGGGDEQQAVAVIDFGVDCNHQELDCDGDVFNEDLIDHGTGVASLISAKSGDGTGLVGVAWNTELYPYSFLGAGGSQYKMSELITLSMSESSIKVINISAATALDPGNQIQNAMCSAVDSGRLIVVAAGNAAIEDGCVLDNIYPSQYNSRGECENGADLASGIIVVGATDEDNNLAEWEGGQLCSNISHVDVYAPGKDIYTASGTSGYASKEGTSFAAPLVAGSAAVIWAAQPTLTVSELHDQLLDSSAILSNAADNERFQTDDGKLEGLPLLDLYSAVGGQEDAPVPTVITPNAFAFNAVVDAELNVLIPSNTVTITGIETSAPIDVTGGFYSIDEGPFTSAAGLVNANQRITIQVRSSEQPNESRRATLTVGDALQNFDVRSELPDTQPDNFNFIDRKNAGLGNNIESNTLSIPGINAETSITIQDGMYAIGGSADFTDQDGTVNADESIQIRVTAANTPETTNTAIITIGGVSDTFSVETEMADIDPVPFTFAAIEGVELNSLQTVSIRTATGSGTSDAIIGINSDAAISISGGQYAIDENEFRDDASTVRAGQRIRVQHISDNAFGSNTFTTLTIGTYSATFRSATIINLAPTASNVRISGVTNRVGDILTSSYDYADLENNPQSAANYQWLRNGTAINAATNNTYTVTAGDSDQVLSLEVTPTATEGERIGIATRSVNTIRVLNSAPTISNIQIVDNNEGPLMVGDVLSVTYVYTDVDEDPEETTAATYAWLRNGIEISGAASATYTLIEADAAQNITVSVTTNAASGNNGIVTIGSPAIVTGNVPPIASSLTISGEPNVNGNLVANFTFNDVDGDLQDTGAELYQWTRNASDIAGATNSIYTITNNDSGENIAFRVTPFAQSGSVEGLAVTSASVAINARPEALNVAIQDESENTITTALVGNVLTAVYNFSDAENDSQNTASTSIRWLRNGSVISGATSETYTVNDEDSGQTLTFDVSPVANTGSVNGVTVPSLGVDVLNSAPVVTNVEISGTTNIGDTLTGSYVYRDDENDPDSGTTFRWLRAGSEQVSVAQNYTISVADNGQTISFEVTPRSSNGTRIGTPVPSSQLLIPANTVPTASNVIIDDTNGGNANVGDVLNSDFDYNDSEGDLEGLHLYQWLRNNVAIAGAVDASYTVIPADSGQDIRYDLTPIAQSGIRVGTVVPSSLITIFNRAPTATGVAIRNDYGSSADIGETLNGDYAYADLDGDLQGTSTFRWIRNGNETVATTRSYEITSADNGLDLVFEVTPVASTGIITGDAVESSPVNVTLNAAPSATAVTIIEANIGSTVVGDVLNGNYTFEDAEDDAEDESTFQWTRNLSPIAGATSQTYTVTEADSGNNIRFNVTPIALTGYPLGLTVQSSPIAVINSAPTVSNIIITDENGDILLVGDRVNVTHAYSDLDGDAQGVSTFRWLRNSAAISGATNNTYTMVAEDSGQIIQVEVTPVALTGTLIGTPLLSGELVTDNSAPVASNVEITGDSEGNANVADVLEAAYFYDDVDNDSEGVTLFQWTRNTIAISGATNNTYTVTLADSGSNIGFSVTPVATGGTTTGAIVPATAVAINNVPTATTVTIIDDNGGNALVGDTLSGDYFFNDIEDDPEGTSAFRWLRNNIAIDGETSMAYTVDLADSGQALTFEVTPIASIGSTTGVAIVSESLGVNNSVPEATFVEINDENEGGAGIGDTLSGSYAYDDLDEDPESGASFRWIRNENTVVGTADTYTLTVDDNGQSLVFEVTPNASSGATPGLSAQSADFSVPLNEAPTVTGVSINDQNGNDAVVGDVLSGVYTYDDSDGDIEGPSRYRWLRNSSPIIDATLGNYTVVLADVGQALSFEVTPVAVAGITDGLTGTSTSLNVVPVFTLLYSAGTGGSISGDAGQTISSGRDGSAVTAVPDTGYSFVQWNDGLTTASRVDTNVTANLNVSASFSLDSYTVNASAGAGGGISPSSQSISHGSAAQIIVTPNTGYSISDVTGCGGSLSGNTFTTGTITSACSVSASFSLDSYTVNASAGAGGNVTPLNQFISHGSVAEINVTPNTGFNINAVTGCGGTLFGNTYTTGAITGACSVSASFNIAVPILANVSDRTYTQNTAISAVNFANSGGGSLTSCSANSLPAGLSVAISGSTCRIAGTPTGTQGVTTHTITATNATGNDTATVRITVNVAAPILANASDRTYTQNTAISAFNFANSGGGSLTSCSANSLPAGLSVAISGSTCRIAGTPTGTQGVTTHTITATNATGNDTATVRITVNVAAPILANVSDRTYTQNTAISAFNFTNSGGGSLTSCSANSLPVGLSVAISGSTCRIAGIPTGTQGATTHTITVTNATGSDTATVRITVNIAAPVLANVSDRTYTQNTAISAFNFANSGGGSLTSCSANSLPAGLSVTISGATCRIAGTPTEAQSATTHTITATNTTGSDTATVRITANAAAPILSLTPQSIKIFRFTWDDISGETEYRLLENPDGLSGFSQIATIPANTTSYELEVSLPLRIDARYILQSCIAGACNDSAPVNVIGRLANAVGYIKSSNSDEWDFFGIQVALSEDGSTLVVGAPDESSNATGINGDGGNNSADSSGAVYVYVKQGQNWSQQAYIKSSNNQTNYSFGYSVSISGGGDLVAVGQPGSAEVYIYSRSGNTWTEDGIIRASNRQLEDSFGSSVSMSGDGSSIAVGARFEDSAATGVNGAQSNNSAENSGSAYVFIRSGGSWVQQAYIKASNTDAGDLFGYVVAISDDGNILAVSAPSEDSDIDGINGDGSNNAASSSGAVYVYERVGGNWSQGGYLKASNSDAGDRFGGSISLRGDGDMLAVGAVSESSNATGSNGDESNNSSSSSGAVYMFSRTNGFWAQNAYLKANYADTADYFGSSVALSDVGNILVVGARGEDRYRTGINGYDLGSPRMFSGAAYMFTYVANSWVQQAYLKSSNTDAGDNFGRSVAMSVDGGVLAIGAHTEDGGSVGVDGNQSDNNEPESGAVYLY